MGNGATEREGRDWRMGNEKSNHACMLHWIESTLILGGKLGNWDVVRDTTFRFCVLSVLGLDIICEQ